MNSNYKLIIGNKNYSSWSMRPWVWMRHHNLSFDTHRIALCTPTTKQEIAQFGCGSTVPILIDGNLKVWDSLAILEYLAERHPQCNGWPTDSAARAHARSVCAEMHSGFLALRSSMPMNCRREIKGFQVSEAVQQDVDRVTEIFAGCRRQYCRAGQWLFGEYSIVDAMFTPVVMRFNTYNVGLVDEPGKYLKTISEQSVVREWIEDSHKENEVIKNVEH